jgi:hypothetical protein
VSALCYLFGVFFYRSSSILTGLQEQQERVRSGRGAWCTAALNSCYPFNNRFDAAVGVRLLASA